MRGISENSPTLALLRMDLKIWEKGSDAHPDMRMVDTTSRSRLGFGHLCLALTDPESKRPSLALLQAGVHRRQFINF